MRVGALLVAFILACIAVMVLFNYTPVTVSDEAGSFAAQLNLDEPDKMLLLLILTAVMYMVFAGKDRRRGRW